MMPVVSTIRRLLLSSLLLGLSTAALPAANGPPLPGTAPLTIAGPLDVVMVDGINRFALRELARTPSVRATHWKQDFSSQAAYAKSVAGNRARLKTIIGAVDPRIASTDIQLVATIDRPSRLGGTKAWSAHRARWDVLDGVTARGLVLIPTGKPVANVIALPDADWTPEQFCGLAPGVPAQAQLARRLVENGCRVIVPTLISRDSTFSGDPRVRFTNQPHREFIYRMAFELGRHVIGYEVQKVQAAIDALAGENQLPTGVVGLGEGGLLALFASAVDTRIDATMVCGYFDQREDVWEEPIYRNVWSQLTEFGDAELAGLIAPRPLVIEACAVPEVSGPPAAGKGRGGGAAPGFIEHCTLGQVRAEFDRAARIYGKLKADSRIALVASGEGASTGGTTEALALVLAGLGRKAAVSGPGPAPTVEGDLPDAARRQGQQVGELVAFTQVLLRRCAKLRDKRWSGADRTSLATWAKTAESYRDMVYDELIGRLPEPTIPPNVRTRQVLDTKDYRGFEVVIDVYRDVIASGILLLPKDIKPGEKRPVVVCQHGLEGVPMDTITTSGNGFRYYKSFAAELAKRGFITYAPQNPYRGRDRFRSIQRKSNPLKRSLFSYIIPQHKRTLTWLSSLPNVDPQRIGFYGLSYGGKTAVRVPPMLKQYALSICSADFNEWVVKNTSSEDGYSYVFTGEYEIFEWNMGHVANYAELSNLMTPRPFMVERGHHDGVAPDEWVGWEFAKVKRHYDLIGIGDRTEMEVFTGPHTINGRGTFDFLHRHLKWPVRTTGKTKKKD
ncbi:MAG: hypothetical protein QF363_17265 [Planctomycetaceae bacterium]|jgi:dienelactone hydrolase|nr:hypothetical protein [Planctomycetaceae bacterium]